MTLLTLIRWTFKCAMTTRSVLIILAITKRKGTGKSGQSYSSLYLWWTAVGITADDLIKIPLPWCWNYLELPLTGVPTATGVIPSVVQKQWIPKSSPRLISSGSHLSRCHTHLHVILVCNSCGIPLRALLQKHSSAAKGTWSSPTRPLGLELAHPLD